MGVQLQKMDVQVDIKSHGDLFHELVVKKPQQLPNITPEKIQTYEVHEGELGKPGSLVSWYYIQDGKKCVSKELLEAIDEENKSVRYKMVDGDPVKDFKSLTITLHAIPKGGITTVVWGAEFEKIADDGPNPTDVLDFCIQMTKDIESHFSQNMN